jgi:hypothetical protein
MSLSDEILNLLVVGFTVVQIIRKRNRSKV